MKHRQGEIEVDPDGLLLIVHYEDLEEKRVRRRRIAIPSVDADPARLAMDILRKYEFIHPSRREELEQKIIQLQRMAREQMKKRDQEAKQQASQPHRSQHNNGHNRQASLAELDSYLDLLYEGTKEDQTPKVQATAKLLELCENVQALEELVKNGTVMSALTRVLKEEHKNSTELSFNILRIFLAFSNFLELHSILTKHHVGKDTIEIIKFEITRIQVRESDLRAKLTDLEKQFRSGVLSVVEYEQKKNHQLAKHQRSEQRRDKLLFVAYCVLMNLAEDITVERKMVKHGIIEMLCAMLTRSSVDLLVLAVTFLKKLSVFEDNKAGMEDTVPLLTHLLDCGSMSVIFATLRLLFNLSFDSAMREKMLRAGMLPKLVHLMKPNTPLRARIMKLMYHLSVEDRCKSMFTFTEGIPIIVEMILLYPQDKLPKELAALAINLSYNPRNAALMVKGLSRFMVRLEDTNDPLLMKIIRNLSLFTFTAHTASATNESSEHEKPRGVWNPHVKALMKLAKSTDNQDLLVEILGTLANLTVEDLTTRSWLPLLQECEFAQNICRWLVPGLCENDIVLEVVMFMAQVASDKTCSMFFASSNLIALAEQTWRDKASDTELVLQSLYLFYWLLQWPDTREEAFQGTRVVLLMIDALQHRNDAVQAWADRCLQTLASQSEAAGSTLDDLQERIKWHRFEAYNRQWVRMTSGEDHWADELEPPQSLRQMMHASMLSMQGDLTGPSSRNWRSLLDQQDDLDFDMMGYDSFSPSQDYHMNNLEWGSRWS